jgi:hypothetical protein
VNARDEIVHYIGEHGGVQTHIVDHLLDTYRVEVLAEDGQAYDGELVMLRSLVRTLRVVARQSDLGEVQRLLIHHAVDDADARDREKSSRKADATPEFFHPGRTYTDGNGYRAPELTRIFRVDHVTRHPDRGHLRAIGWMRSGEADAKWHGDFRDEDEFDGWSEIVAGGEG